MFDFYGFEHNIVLLGTAIIALTAIVASIFKVWRVANATEKFLKDWNGRPSVDGNPAQPGVMSRLKFLEAQVTPNSGTSLRDVADRIEGSLGQHINDATVLLSIQQTNNEAIREALKQEAGIDVHFVPVPEDIATFHRPQAK